MSVNIDIELCKNCGLCKNVCKKNVYEHSQNKVNKKGYNYIEAVRESDCVKCKLCEKICPDFVIHIE